MNHPVTFTAVHALQPVRRRLGITRIRTWTLRGLAAGAVLALALLATAHIVAMPWGPLPMGIASMALGTLVGGALGVWRWPDSPQAARVADRYFGLQDRLTTALEYRSSTDPFPSLQRDEVGRRVDGLRLEASGSAPLDWWEVGGTGVLIVAFVALVLFGGTSPGHARAATTAEGRQVQKVTVTRVRQITRKAEGSFTAATANNPTLHKLQVTLEQLRHQLEHTSTRAGALRAISGTQARLQHLASSLHPVSKQAVAQLNSSLAPSMTPQQRAAAASSDRQALAVAAQTLHKLATRLNHMTAMQRAHLARSLAQAANSTSDSQLKAALRQAASSLGYNDAQSAAKALQAAARAVAQTPMLNNARFHLVQANAQLDSLKNAVSGGSPGASQPGSSNSAASGASGTGSGSSQANNGPSADKAGRQGANGSPGAGLHKGKGAGRGNSASGGGAGSSAPSSGKSSNSGAAAGANGKGAPGAHGAGGGRGGAGPTGQGRYATVYVPFTQGKGPSSTQTGPNGAPQSGPIIPYQQVVSAYSQTAHQALDRANLPPALRSYVRKYFSTVSH